MAAMDDTSTIDAPGSAAILRSGVYDSNGVLPLAEVSRIVETLPQPDQVWGASSDGCGLASIYMVRSIS